MASNINPDNINTAYPVAGQDNNTQGFRTNFTNIKTNFEYAEQEITALQSGVVYVGDGENNNLDGALIYNGVVKDLSATRNAIGTTSGAVVINYALGHYQTITLSGSTSFSFTNWPTSGQQAWLIVRVTVNNTAHTLTLPAAVGTGASATSLIGVQGLSSNVITFAETGTFEFGFRTEDNGTSVYLEDITRPKNKYTNPLFLTGSEDLASTAAASLVKTASYFSTASSETATLAAGVEGQIKVFAMYATSGDMVITVTNAGWKSSGTGTITFDTIGDACTLMYINSKWFCVGNNGCTFA